MHEADTLEIARLMIRMHGLRAQAVALERREEQRLAGDTLGLDRWQAVHTAICDQRYGARARPGVAGEPAGRA